MVGVVGGGKVYWCVVVFVCVYGGFSGFSGKCSGYGFVVVILGLVVSVVVVRWDGGFNWCGDCESWCYNPNYHKNTKKNTKPSTTPNKPVE